MRAHKCKFHGRQHDYTVCPDCGSDYCSDVWTVCPRTSWHWAHATDQAEREARALSMAVAADINRERLARRNAER